MAKREAKYLMHGESMTVRIRKDGALAITNHIATSQKGLIS